MLYVIMSDQVDYDQLEYCVDGPAGVGMDEMVNRFHEERPELVEQCVLKRRVGFLRWLETQGFKLVVHSGEVLYP